MFYFVSIDILQAFDSIEIKKQCNIKWYLFIKDFIYKLNVLYNITIDYKWFESLCIIEIYKLYIQKKMVTNNSCTNTTTTITKYAPPKSQLYVGGGIGGNKTLGVTSLNAGLLLKTKSDQIYNVTLGTSVEGQISYGFQTFWKLKK